MTKSRSKAFLSHKGVNIYDTYKDGRAYRPWLSIMPGQPVEGSSVVFDARLVPKRYRQGLVIQYPAGAGGTTDLHLRRMAREERDTREALRRAIDDGFDFEMACRGDYAQIGRRFERWLKSEDRRLPWLSRANASARFKAEDPEEDLSLPPIARIRPPRRQPAGITSAITAFLDRTRLRRALGTYPAYLPPFPGDPSGLTTAQIKANFEKFAASIDERLAHLATFLGSFGVTLTVDDDGCRRVGEWIERYGRFLAEGKHVRLTTLSNHDRSWTGKEAWASLVQDLGTYAGAVVRSKHGLSEWRPSLVVDKDMIGYGQACLELVAHNFYGEPVYMAYQIYDFCETLDYVHERSVTLSHWARPRALSTFVNVLVGVEEPKYIKLYEE